MVIKQPIFISWILLFLQFGCEEVIQRPIQSQDTNVLVVDGIITNEKKKHKIILSLPYKNLNGNPLPASGAIIEIAEGNKIYNTTETPANSGLYFTEVFQAIVGTSYSLHIQYQGKNYFASDSSLPVEPLQVLSYRKINDNAYTINFAGAGQIPNFIEHQFNWQNTPVCTTASCKGEVFFYDLKTIDANEAFKSGKANFLFPLGTIIIRKKYSTSDSYRSFLRSVLSETEWRGGFFDVDRANAPTNLSTGAIGFFAVSTVVSDSTVVKP